MELEIKRKVVHALGVFSVLLILMFGRFYAALLMLLIAIGLVFVGEYRKNKLLSKLLDVVQYVKGAAAIVAGGAEVTSSDRCV